MKKLLGFVVLGLLWCSNVNALPSWIGDKPIKICKASQDVKVSMNWYKDNGKLDGDPVYTSIKKGDYLGYFKRVKGSDKNKKERYWVKSNGFFIPFLLTVRFIDVPTGPLMSLTASIKDFP